MISCGGVMRHCHIFDSLEEVYTYWGAVVCSHHYGDVLVCLGYLKSRTTVIIWVDYHCACINCCPFACCLFVWSPRSL